tara:strand:+ start:1168 stop:1461 length:294 start_codon:yes stop_codon:yes gene_type:complete
MMASQEDYDMSQADWARCVSCWGADTCGIVIQDATELLAELKTLNHISQITVFKRSPHSEVENQMINTRMMKQEMAFQQNRIYHAKQRLKIIEDGGE